LDDVADKVHDIAHPVIAELLTKLGHIREQLLEVGEETVAVVGSVGEGKSTLINALLGNLVVEKSGGAQSCTSVVTEICYSDRPEFESIVEFFSEQEWLELAKEFQETIRAEFDSPSQRSEDYKVAVETLNSVYFDGKLKTPYNGMQMCEYD